MKKLVTLALALLMVLGIAFPVAFNKAPVVAEATEDVKTADIYFIAGQSNAAGYTQWQNGGVYNTLKYADQLGSFTNSNAYPDVLYYGYAGDWQNAHGGIMKTDLKPVTSGLGAWSTAIGAELGMAHVLQPLYEDNETTDAIIVKYAVGSSSIDGLKGCPWGNWGSPSNYNASTHVGENLYTNMVGTEQGLYEDGFIHDALKALKSKGYKKINFKGLFWAQGEAEKGDYNRSSTYNEKLSKFIKDFRNDLVKMVETRLLYSFGLTFSDPSDMSFLVSEICVTFGGASKLDTPGYEGQSSDAGIQRVLDAEREVATDTTSQYYVPNTYLLDTQDYVIKKTGDATDLSESNKGSFCYDNAHYAGDDILEIGMNAGTMMYNFEVGDAIEIEKPEGFWIKINEKIAVRTSASESVDTFQLENYVVTVNKTYDGENLSSVDVSVAMPDEYEITELGYQLGNKGTLAYDAKQNGLEFEGNNITVPQLLLQKIAVNGVVYVNVNIKLKPVRTINPTLTRVVLSEEIGGEYAVGEVISFKVYVSSVDYLGYVLSECTYNGQKLTPNADGVFTFTVDEAETQSLVVKATTSSFAGNNKIDYELTVAPGVEVPDDGTTEVPDNGATETPDNGTTSGGMNCAMGVSSEIGVITVLAVLGAVAIVLKRKLLVK